MPRIENVSRLTYDIIVIVLMITLSLSMKDANVPYYGENMRGHSMGWVVSMCVDGCNCPISSFFLSFLIN